MESFWSTVVVVGVGGWGLLFSSKSWKKCFCICVSNQSLPSMTKAQCKSLPHVRLSMCTINQLANLSNLKLLKCLIARMKDRCSSVLVWLFSHHSWMRPLGFQFCKVSVVFVLQQCNCSVSVLFVIVFIVIYYYFVIIV